MADGNALTPPAGGTFMSDGLMNLMSRLGVPGADRNASNTYRLPMMTQWHVETAYRTSWLARRVHDLPAKDMTREWRTWQAKDTTLEALEAEEKRLKLRASTRAVIQLARLYGGGVLVLGLAPRLGSPETPLRVEDVRKGELLFAHPMNRHQAHVARMNYDPLSPNYGRPEVYRIGPTGTEVHHTRVIPMVGQPVPVGAMMVTDHFWGDPLLMSITTAIENADVAQGSVASLLHELAVDTLGIPGLSVKTSTAEGEALLRARVAVSQAIKSSMNVRLIDAGNAKGEGGEKWETRQLNLAGMPDIVGTFLNIVAGASSIPVTKLLGTPPKGLNATGEHDEANYQTFISAEREDTVQPFTDALDPILVRSATGQAPPKLFALWNPLSDPDPVEQSDVEDTVATTISTLAPFVPQSVSRAAAESRMAASGLFPGIEDAITAAKGEPTKAEADQAAEAAASANDDEPADRRRALNDAAPRSLYVSRKVMNPREIARWAADQGIQLVPQSELHVTVMYSRTPVDWMKVPADWNSDESGRLRIPAGGPRSLEVFGDVKPVLVLEFVNSELTWRHERMKDAGAVPSHAEYRPHITLSATIPADLSALKPYTGRIVLGPEIFEEVREG